MVEMSIRASSLTTGAKTPGTNDMKTPKTSSANPRRNPGRLQRLVRCVRALGWRLGWRYWRIQNKVLKNPDAAKEWAIRCRKEAIVSPKELSDCFLDWAVKLEASMEKWEQQQKAPNEKS